MQKTPATVTKVRHQIALHKLVTNLYTTSQFQKRWFTLENDRLSYYENVLVKIKVIAAFKYTN